MGVGVSGDSELIAGLRAAAADLQRADLSSVADQAAVVMAGFIPVRTGRARRSIAVVPARGGVAQVTAGGPRAPYVPILRTRHRSRFVERTDAVMESRAAELIEQEWNAIAERHGLT
jgi:hypothetical protein